ncbi:unnamed protein product [Durusdinium trenchii]|uniref:Uncharacterized protein n=1 Tax=Durusdinium trenchii TaxID=1381693 RepID=A0ABP0NMQ9_9DINO
MWQGPGSRPQPQFLAVAPQASEGRRSAPPGSLLPGFQQVFQARPGDGQEAERTDGDASISPRRDASPRQPFLMPNMDPLVRQQGLLFQQSELLREQFMKFAEALQRLHSSVEELREDLLNEHHQRVHGEEHVASTLSSLRVEVHEQMEEKMGLLREEVNLRSKSSEVELQRLGSCVEGVSQQLGAQIITVAEDQRSLTENLAAFQVSVGNTAVSKTALEELRNQVEKELQVVLNTTDGALREREASLIAAMKEEIATVRSEALIEAEQWRERFSTVEAASERLCAEMAAEHQQTRISAVGLATELSELRDALSKESQSYQESTTSVQRWVTETMSLKQSLQEEEIAQAALSNAVAENKLELEKQVAIAKTLAEATAEYKNGKEELWQAMSSIQDTNEQNVKDIESLRLRTQHMELQRFGQVTRQLEELTVQQGDTTGKLERVEQAQSNTHRALSSKLGGHSQELQQAQAMLNQLSEQNTQHEYIESRDRQYRLCVTMDGDIGIFRRSGWGKHGGDFAGVPRWHAGAVGDKALCSVNRETQAYEKDRFLAMANRELQT